MSEYFAAVVIISSLVAFFELFSYSGGEEKGERLAASVIVLYLIIFPLVPIIEDLDFNFSDLKGELGSLDGGAYETAAEDAFREGIQKLLSKGAFSDFHEIEDYIENAGLGKCEVEYAIQ